VFSSSRSGSETCPQKKHELDLMKLENRSW